LSISGLLDATLYQPMGAMGGHGGKRSREDESDGGTRACGSIPENRGQKTEDRRQRTVNYRRYAPQI
jgi:hypothetical protein